MPTRFPIGLLVVLLPLATAVHAGEWDFEPRIRVAETVTDNIELAESDKEAEWVTEVTPGFNLSGKGKRGHLDLTYHAQTLLYREDSDRDQVNHEVGADGSLELVRDHLFLDGDATRIQDVISADETTPSNNLYGNRRRTVSTYGLGPRFRYGLGSFAQFQARYRRSYLEREDSGRDTTTDATFVDLTSGPRFNDWGWAAHYERTQEDNEGGRITSYDRRFERASGELNVRAGARTELFVAGGTENNEFRSTTEDEIDGNFWETGIRWNPTRHSNLEVAVGERFFGTTKRFSFNAKGPALSFDINYQEELKTRRQLQEERSQQIVRDAEGNILRNLYGEPVRVNVPLPTLVNEVVQEDRLSGRIAWERGVSRISLSFFGSNRHFLQTGGTEKTRGAAIGYRWTRLVRTVVNFRVGMSEQEFARRDREDDLWTVRLGATRELGRGVTGSAVFEFDDRNSNVTGEDYQVSQLTVALEKTF